MSLAIELCGICGSTEPEHQALNHEFSLTGQLIPKELKKKPTQNIRIVNSVDVVLRAVLIGKGLITAEDLRVIPEREVRNGTNEDSSTG